VILGRKYPLDTRELFDRLAAGQRPKEISLECGLKSRTVEARIRRYMQPKGIRTPEQAVALHVAEKIKRSLPLALHQTVDFVMRKR
jgi:DNA-binding NarL/FixJ family response regulator